MPYLGHMSISTDVGVVPEWTIADRMRKSREHAGLDQGELAELIGIARNTVSNYERAQTEPRRPALIAWSMATGVPLAWLETGTAPHPEGPAPDGEKLPRLDSNQEPAVYRSAQVSGTLAPVELTPAA